MKRCLLALALLLGLQSAALAQFAGGNLYGTATDESGAALPGATVQLTSANTASRITTTGTQGDFRFLNVDPGKYQLVVALTGFATVKRDVLVNTGVNVNLTLGLKVATVEETVTVTADTPIVDTKKGGTGVNVSREELSKIPNGRDPWVLLQTIPGVVVDRVNIAGNESGQQSSFQGKGSERTDATWSLDGVTVTDTGALGASPNYFDFNSFDEVNFSTGGSDLKQQTGGIGLSFVTRRGTNTFHGAVQGVLAHRDLESSNLPDELAGDPRLRGSDKADHIDQVGEYGAELGGPILKDKLWFWVAYDKQDIRIERLNRTKDRTLLDNWSGKLNWQVSQKNTLSGFWYLGEKIKYGRAGASAGLGFAGPVEENTALWGQGGVYAEGRPHGLFKLEDNHTFSPNFFASVKLAYYNTGFSLTPNGDFDEPGTIDLDAGSYLGTSYLYSAGRPQYIANFDANYFAAGWGGNHEVKFGFGYRSTPVESLTSFGGDKLLGIKDEGADRVWVIRDNVVNYGTTYWNAYLGDTFTKNRLTVNLGLRFDRQSGENSASSAGANPAFPELLPAIDFAGGGQGVEWTDLSPRASFTYALDESRRTVVRASYARYASQLGTGVIDDDNPLALAYLAYGWNDANRDGFVQKSEVQLDQFLYAGGVDPANPGNASSSPNAIDPDFKAKHDHEFIVGLDRELAPNLAVSASYTWRRASDLQWIDAQQVVKPRNLLTSADYYALPPVSSRGFTVTPYDTTADAVARGNSGRATRNRPDYALRYNGLELGITKRLSNRWMGRVAFSLMDWQERYEGPAAIQDPSARDVDTKVDGGQFAPLGGGSGKGNIFYSTKWQVSANALVQLGWGFELAGSLFGRQGFPFVQVIRVNTPVDGAKNMLATPEVDDARYGDVWNLDFRLAKTIKIAGSSSLNINLDLFNALNSDLVMVQQRTLNTTVFNRIDEVLSPRILRIGATFRF